MIYGLLNADISDNATVYWAIPFGHYMGDHIVSLNEHTCSDGIRTKHPLDKTPPAHFGIGGRNTPHVFYRVDITPPATFDRVDKTPL